MQRLICIFNLRMRGPKSPSICRKIKVCQDLIISLSTLLSVLYMKVNKLLWIKVQNHKLSLVISTNCGRTGHASAMSHAPCRVTVSGAVSTSVPPPPAATQLPPVDALRRAVLHQVGANRVRRCDGGPEAEPAGGHQWGDASDGALVGVGHLHQVRLVPVPLR